MSKKESVSSVMKEHAQKLFEEFNPYREWEAPLKKLFIFSCFLSALLVLSLLFRTYEVNAELFWTNVVLVALTLFLWALGRSVIKTERIQQFKTEHRDLATILGQ